MFNITRNHRVTVHLRDGDPPAGGITHLIAENEVAQLVNLLGNQDAVISLTRGPDPAIGPTLHIPVRAVAYLTHDTVPLLGNAAVQLWQTPRGQRPACLYVADPEADEAWQVPLDVLAVTAGSSFEGDAKALITDDVSITDFAAEATPLTGLQHVATWHHGRGLQLVSNDNGGWDGSEQARQYIGPARVEELCWDEPLPEVMTR